MSIALTKTLFSSHNTEPGQHIRDSPYRATALASFLPRTTNETVLLTSRNTIAAINLMGKKDNVIRVEPMAEDDALEVSKA